MTLCRILAWVFCLAGTVFAADYRDWRVGTSIRFSPDLSATDLIQLKQAGIEVVELGLIHVDTREKAAEWRNRSEQVRVWAEQAGVEIWSVHLPFGKNLDISVPTEEERLEVLRRYELNLEAYGALRPAKMVIHGSAEPIDPGDRAARIAAARRSLASLAQRTSGLRAQLALECLPRTCIGRNSTEIAAMIEGIDEVGVCLDTNHLLEERSEDFIRKIGRRIVSIHAADFDGVDERHWMPGKGINDWPAIVRALVAVGYKGPFLFESAGTAREKVAWWGQLKTMLASPAMSR